MSVKSSIGSVIRAAPVLHRAILEFARFRVSPRMEAVVWLDWIRTRREIRFLRSLRAPGDGRPVLLISLTELVYQLKNDAMFGLALKLAGTRPVALLHSRLLSGRARRYFRAFGIEDFVYLEDYGVTADEDQRCAATAAEFLSRPLGFETVKEWSFDGIWIGPQILTTVSRKLFTGAPDPGDPTVRREIERLLPETLRLVCRARRLVADVNPRLAVACETNFAHYGPWTDVLMERGTDVIQYIQGWIDDGYFLARRTPETRRMHPAFIGKARFEQLCRRPWTDAEERALDRVFEERYGGRWYLQGLSQPGVRDKAPADVRRQLGLSIGKKTVVVFAPVLWDANLFYGDDLFADFGEWFIETVKAACGNPAVDWVFKLHPANLWKRDREGIEAPLSEDELIRRRVGDLPAHVRLLYPGTEISARSLFRVADYGVTVRGTAGMELPCFGVPSLTAGTGRYAGLGFTIDSRTREEYLDRLARIQDIPPLPEAQVLLAKRHAHAAFVQRPWPRASFRAEFHAPRFRGDPLESNLRPACRSLADIEANGDLRAFAEWALGSREVEYLRPAPTVPTRNDGKRWYSEIRKLGNQ